MGERAGYWSDLYPKVENAISNRISPKDFSGVPYYLAEFYLGYGRAKDVAQLIRDHGYLVRILSDEKKGVWYIYTRRK